MKIKLIGVAQYFYHNIVMLQMEMEFRNNYICKNKQKEIKV